MSTLIIKFGGTSVGSAEAISQAARIAQQARTEFDNLAIVTSAMSGVTDLLLSAASAAERGDMQAVHQTATQLRDRHFDAIRALLPEPFSHQLQLEIEPLITEFVRLCQAVQVLGEATPRALDAVASLGERMSVRLVAAALETNSIPARAIEATRLIVTDDNHQAAHPDFPATTARVRTVIPPLVEQGIVPVITGFLAATPDGVATTLGRGGSDYSAAIIAAALPADEVWIYTDVDGVMTADPRIVPEARTIPELTFREVGELAYFGAKVLHPKTIRPVIEAGIGLRVRNTFNPGHPGTRILSNGEAVQARGVIKAVTAIHGQRFITIEGRGMLGVPGVAARAFQAVAETGASVVLITQASSEQSICFSISAQAAGKVIAALERAFAVELAQRDIDRIWATDETVIVTAVGAGMQYTPGVAGRIFTALGEAGANVIAIAQGASEAAISMVVAAADAQAAVRAIHGLIV